MARADPGLRDPGTSPLCGEEVIDGVSYKDVWSPSPELEKCPDGLTIGFTLNCRAKDAIPHTGIVTEKEAKGKQGKGAQGKGTKGKKGKSSSKGKGVGGSNLGFSGAGAVVTMLLCRAAAVEEGGASGVAAEVAVPPQRATMRDDRSPLFQPGSLLLMDPNPQRDIHSEDVVHEEDPGPTARDVRLLLLEAACLSVPTEDPPDDEDIFQAETCRLLDALEAEEQSVVFEDLS
eukprot:gene20170-31684_t